MGNWSFANILLRSGNLTFLVEFSDITNVVWTPFILLYLSFIIFYCPNGHFALDVFSIILIIPDEHSSKQQTTNRGYVSANEYGESPINK